MGKRVHRRIRRPKDEAPLGFSIAAAVLALIAVLLVPSTYEVTYLAIHRHDYALREMEVIGPLTVHGGGILVSPAVSEKPIVIRSNDFPELQSGETIRHYSAKEGDRFRAWYNPRARKVAGIVLYDLRVVSTRRYGELPSTSDALKRIGVTAGLLLAAWLLHRWKPVRRAA